MNKKADNTASSQPVRTKSSYRAFMKDVFDGTILTKGFLVRNVWMILIIVAGMLIYIGNHYGVIMNLNKIDDLKEQLADVKFEALTHSSMLMRESRQSRIRELVHEKGMELEDSKIPPYAIRLTD